MFTALKSKASKMVRILLAVLTLLFCCLEGYAQPPAYDFLITHAQIVDGTGAPWFYGDLAISGDRIAAIGNLRGAKAKQTFHATGLVVAPGFIDVQGQSEFNILVDGRAASKITQGVTTEITGEGTSIAPANDRVLEEFRA